MGRVLSWVRRRFRWRLLLTVILVFSLENVIDLVFEQYAPLRSEFVGWVLVFVGTLALASYWGEQADDQPDE